MSSTVIKIAKFVVTVIGAGLTLATALKKEATLDEKISKKVKEELSKSNKDDE